MMMTNILIIRFASGGRVHRSSSSPWGHSGMVSHLMKLMEFVGENNDFVGEGSFGEIFTCGYEATIPESH